MVRGLHGDAGLEVVKDFIDFLDVVVARILVKGIENDIPLGVATVVEGDQVENLADRWQ